MASFSCDTRLQKINMEKAYWDTLHARLNSHYKAWNYDNKKYKEVKEYGIFV